MTACAEGQLTGRGPEAKGAVRPKRIRLVIRRFLAFPFLCKPATFYVFREYKTPQQLYKQNFCASGPAAVGGLSAFRNILRGRARKSAATQPYGTIVADRLEFFPAAFIY